jgi:hypothetical protein
MLRRVALACVLAVALYLVERPLADYLFDLARLGWADYNGVLLASRTLPIVCSVLVVAWWQGLRGWTFVLATLAALYASNVAFMGLQLVVEASVGLTVGSAGSSAVPDVMQALVRAVVTVSIAELVARKTAAIAHTEQARQPDAP